MILYHSYIRSYFRSQQKACNRHSNDSFIHTKEKDNPVINHTSDISDMSGEIAGMENPAFSDDLENTGTPGKTKSSDVKEGETHDSETNDSSKTNGHEKSVPTAHVAPRVQKEQGQNLSESSEAAKREQITDLDSVAVAMNAETGNTYEKDDKGPSVAVNMVLERVKGSAKRTGSVKKSFDKVNAPSKKELDPR